MYFVIFALLIAAAWATVGILLAKWLKQSGHARPFKGRNWDSRELYGGGSGYGRDLGLGGSSSQGRGQNGRERGVGIPLTGVGRVKGF